ncbi:MAG: redoxin domain-containing protein [Acidobacteriota bacterium]
MSEPPTPPTKDSPSRLRTVRRWLLEAMLIVGLAAIALTLVGRLRAPTLPEVAPGFELTALDGSSVRLDDLRGRTVVLNFWAEWCPPCRTEIPSFSRFARNNPEIAVLGLAVDGTLEELRVSRRELGIDYPVLRADDATVAAYGVSSLPTTVIVDPEGRIRTAHAGMLFRPQLWWLTR